MKVIETTNGTPVWVSDEDADLDEYVWFVNSSGYAIRSGDYRPYLERMHRIIAARMAGRDLMRSEVVDHKNRNRLDNRRSNLRVVSTADNNRNVKPRAKSGYKGVYRNPGSSTRPWVAKITVDYRQVYLGSFATRKDAANAYVSFAASLPQAGRKRGNE